MCFQPSNSIANPGLRACGIEEWGLVGVGVHSSHVLKTQMACGFRKPPTPSTQCQTTTKYTRLRTVKDKEQDADNEADAKSHDGSRDQIDVFIIGVLVDATETPRSVVYQFKRLTQRINPGDPGDGV